MTMQTRIERQQRIAERLLATLVLVSVIYLAVICGLMFGQ